MARRPTHIPLNVFINGRLVGVLEVRQRRRAGLLRLRLVAEDERAVAVVVLEEEGDARLLEQARDEGEVALAVLDLDLQLGVATAVDPPRRRCRRSHK